MSTSDRIVVAEAAGAAAAVVALVALFSPGDVWLTDLGLHPMWLPIIVLAARYAARGLFPALVMTAGGMIALSFALGDSIEGLAARTESPSDLIALTTAVLVAWVAMAHEGRIARVHQRLAEATEAQQQAEDSVQALHDTVAYLRGRNDRLDVSLSLWRSLSFRLERGDASEAARAVLELCEIRAGAQAGTVQLRDGMRLSMLACRGQWSPTSARPHDLEGDATVCAAIESRCVTPAPPGSSEHDADVAVPVIDETSGVVIAVIALRGVAPGTMRAPDLRDLGVLAQWLAPSVARELRRQFGKALIQFQAPRKKAEASL